MCITMNIGTNSCLFMAILFGFMAIVFALLKEKGAMLIGGFNTLPKEEREKYDKERMSCDQRNAFVVWMVVFVIGALVSYFVSTYAVIVASIIWLILFFKDFHFDTEKAFGKYRK